MRQAFDVVCRAMDFLDKVPQSNELHLNSRDSLFAISLNKVVVHSSVSDLRYVGRSLMNLNRYF